MNNSMLCNPENKTSSLYGIWGCPPHRAIRNKGWRKSGTCFVDRQMRVIVESPFAGGFANVKYARRCVRDCIGRGESPFASHLLYTQKGLLDDTVSEERKQGIDAAIGWLEVADFVVVYMDLGVTKGMMLGIVRAIRLNKPIKMRWLDEDKKEEIIE